VVRTERPAGALQRVLGQGLGRLRLPEQEQGRGEGGRRRTGNRVVRAEHPAAALQRVLTQGAGRLNLGRLVQGLHQD
jgi:hypothetical protein